jgi:RND family efflux transporter MFP subunit
MPIQSKQHSPMTEPVPITPEKTADRAAATQRVAQLSIERGTGAPRRRSRVPWGWVAAASIAAALVAAFFLVPRQAEVQATSVLAAYPSQQYAQLTASGYVVAQRRAAVASKATGRLLELRVREGSVVKQGELLARLDASDVKAQIGAAAAGQKQAEAAVRQAEAALRQAQVEQGNAEAELTRTLGLQAQGFVSPQAVDQVRTRAASAQAAAATARAGIDTARATVAQAQANIRLQQVNADYTEIRAPFDGVVLVKNANVGDIITPFSSAAGAQGAVVTMADMGTLEVEADVSEGNLARVRIGQPVEISLDAFPDARFRGKVAGIVPTVDRAKATVMTKIQFEKLEPRILPQMSAKVTFLSQPASDADQQPVLAVNPAALAERGGAKLVLRIRGDTLEAVPVTIGRKLGDVLEVTGALKSGDKLVLKPGDKLAAGAKVTVVTK